MSEIPDDIRREAMFRAKFIEQEFEENDRFLTVALEIVADTIARALLAERERAAKIAENNDHFPQEGAFIAAAILGSDHTASMEAAATGYLSRRRAIKEGE